MGNVNKLVYSKQEYLYYHIHRKEYQKVKQILTKNPELLDKPITKDTKHTLLMRAVFSTNLQSVQYMLGQGANPNIVTPKGQTALTIAIRKNQVQIVELLLAKGADVNVENSQGIKPVDLAILQGLIDIAKPVYAKMSPKVLKQTFEYQDLGKKFQYRYVNYPTFLKLLLDEQGDAMQPQNNYLKKQKVQLYDPVPDPRENWKQWFKRNVDFKDAPMVERSSLPEELQPQNRTLGKFDILIQNLVKSDAIKKSSYKPKQGREVMSQMNDLVERNGKKQGAPDYQSAV